MVQGRQWEEPPEKRAEFESYGGLSNEQKAESRIKSVWREIDKSCIAGGRRFLTTIKSGPNCINDTQVNGMETAIANHHRTWLRPARSVIQIPKNSAKVGDMGTDCAFLAAVASAIALRRAPPRLLASSQNPTS